MLSTPAGNTKPYVYDGRPFYRNQSSTIRMPQNRYLQMLKTKRHLTIRGNEVSR